MNGTSQPIPIHLILAGLQIHFAIRCPTQQNAYIHFLFFAYYVCMTVGYYHTYIVQVRGWSYIKDALSGDEMRAAAASWGLWMAGSWMATTAASWAPQSAAR